jgi:tetratricopeptide (TPR) repeat protein
MKNSDAKWCFVVALVLQLIAASAPAQRTDTNAVNAADQLFAESKYAEAVLAYKQAIEANAGAPYGEKARLLRRLANAQLETRAGTDALATYQKIERDFPADTYVRDGSIAHSIGAILLTDGRLDEALAKFQQAEQIAGGGYFYTDAQATVHSMRRDNRAAAAAELRAMLAAPALKYMRASRESMNAHCRSINKTILADQGKPFVRQPLPLAQAVIDAENSGVGLAEALAALGVSVPDNWAATVAEVTQQAADAVAGKLEPTDALLVRIETCLGVAGAQQFEADYNRGAE